MSLKDNEIKVDFKENSKKKEKSLNEVYLSYIFNLSFILSIGSENELSNAEAPKSILFWNTEEATRFQEYTAYSSNQTCKKSPEHYSFTYQLVNLDSLTYRYGGRKHALDDYINIFKVAGLIVVKDDKIL